MSAVNEKEALLKTKLLVFRRVPPPAIEANVSLNVGLPVSAVKNAVSLLKKAGYVENQLQSP